MLLALLLILAGLVGAIAPQTAKAEDYGLEVAGIGVTSENASNITGPGITGKVSFDPGTRTLTLDNATIEGEIRDERDNIILFIELKGSNTIKGFDAIYMRAGSLHITPGGGGSLTIEAGAVSISVKKDVTIENCTLTADRRMKIVGNLQIKNSNVYVSDNSSAAYQVTGVFTLSGCQIVYPAGGQIKKVAGFGGSGYTVVNASNNVCTEVCISTGSQCHVTPGPDNPEPKPKAPKLTLNPEELEVDASAQKKKVTLTSDVPVHINRVNAPGWIDWSEESGEAYSKSYPLTISFEPNNEGSMRAGGISFVVAPEGGDEYTVTLPVKQKAAGDKPEPKPEEPKLTLSISFKGDASAIPAGGGTKEVTVTSNGQWSASLPKDCKWLTLDKDGGTNDGTLTLTAKENTAYEPRKVTLTVSLDKGDKSQTLEITQAAKPKPQDPEPTLTVSATSVTFPPEGGDPKIIPVKSSHGWSVERDVSKGTGDWITFGEQPEGLYISVEENTGTRQRAVQLFVISDKNLKNGQPLKRTVLVTQQAKKPAEAVSGLSINPAAITMGSGGGMVGFNVYAGKGWTISGNPDWMHPDATRGSGTRLVIVRFDRNESGAERTGKLTVKSDDGKAERTFTLTQRASQRKPSRPSDDGTYDYDLAIGTEEITVGPSEGAGSSISVATSRLWAGSTTEDWIRLESAVGRGNGSFTFSLAANPSKEMRHGTITVRTEHGMDELKVAIHQQGRVGDEEAPTRVKVSSVSLDPSSITVNGDLSTALISAIVSPDNARNKGLLWMSSNAAVATVKVTGTSAVAAALSDRPQLRFAPDADDYALVTIVGKGKATIAATASDGSGIVARCEVNVLSTVANTVPYAPTAKVYTVGPTLYLSLPTPEAVQVYTLAGTLYRTWQAPAGDTSVTLPLGTYIIKVGPLTEKVVVR